ncbi:four helix bundle protein [Aestuariibaculum marinum]|uniref:Four helix bundle protein n=1 Tax=Aestuariibaculum marinum TaxID=2683592 RepID=A0A8J6PU52_9FLAO|nr:four helix bundle protein [Aestuariibaculum marinum]MBD0824284.1 four helix bundle protein [Aestuariibaculum marinum]
MNNFNELIIWQKSMDLVEQVYQLTSILPEEEKFGLKSQIQRSAVSIPSNIAEGAGRNSDKEFKRFLEISNGSINELMTQLKISVRVGYIPENDLKIVFALLNEIQKMNYTLIKKFSNI